MRLVRPYPGPHGRGKGAFEDKAAETTMCRVNLRKTLAATAAVAGLAGATAALAADKTVTTTPHSARAATARATAYARDEDDARTGLVRASGDDSASNARHGTSASASTADYKGSASAAARVTHIAIFGDLVTAAGASVKANAAGGVSETSGRVSSLHVAGELKGSPTSRRTYDLDGYGTLVVLDDNPGSILALRAKLTRAYKAYPAGSTVKVAFASASAQDGSPPPKPKPAKPKPKPHKTKPKPDEQDKKPHKKAKRRKPSRAHVLLTAKRFVFPVYGKHRYSDTFGAFRADTGIHEGNDIFAAAGTPLVAVCDGKLNRVGTLPISGNRLWVKCDKTGDSFFYAHLSAFATDTRNKAQVKAGQVIGFVGSTGDAEQTPPHLHFEVHPGDRDAVDPYPFLKAWESRRDVPAAAWVRENGQIGEQQPGNLVVVKDFLSR